jgi:hypothetical protein
VILSAKAPNRRRALPPFGRRDDPGPPSRHTEERKWTRPHCSSSSSWCCCSAAADSSTDAGFDSDRRFARRDFLVSFRTDTAHTGCRRSWRDRRPCTSRVYDRHIVARPIRWQHNRSSREIATPRERGTHTAVAPTQIDRGHLWISVPRDTAPRTVALMDDTSKALGRWVTFAGCVLVVVVLYWAQAVLVPIALAILLTFVLAPPVTWLQRWIGRIPA